VKWPEAKNFAHLVCAQMAGDSPTNYLDTMSKAQRTGRIFLDYLRNDKTATAVAVLSPRAREGAPVSMPLNWESVKSNLDPKRYDIRTAQAILKKSGAWAEYAKAHRPLRESIARLVAPGKKPRSR
jgi:bifunctional non-homologous end joining protein LigD